MVKEIKSKIADSGCRRFMFVDNYFGAHRRHAKALVRRILDEGIKFKGNLNAGVERFAAYLAHRAIIEDIERRYLPLLYEVEEGL